VGTDFPNFEGYDWGLLRAETEKIMALAGELGLWVALGSTHRLTEPNKPYNSLYLINPRGRIIDRYDKRFCTPGDLRRLTPGERFVHFTVKGVKCSLLICFDLRFPEVYRELYRQGVQWFSAFCSLFITPGRAGRACIRILCGRRCSAGRRRTFFGSAWPIRAGIIRLIHRVLLSRTG